MHKEKFTLKELYTIDASLGKLLSAELPAVISWKLIKVVKSLRGDVQILNQARKTLIEKYAVGEQNNRSVPKEVLPDFEKEMEELMSQTVEFEYEKVPLKALEKVKLSPKEMTDLERFISD